MFYVYDGSTEIIDIGKIEAKYFMSIANHMYWQKQSEIYYVHDGLTEIVCISKNEAKCFLFVMDIVYIGKK